MLYCQNYRSVTIESWKLGVAGVQFIMLWTRGFITQGGYLYRVHNNFWSIYMDRWVDFELTAWLDIATVAKRYVMIAILWIHVTNNCKMIEACDGVFCMDSTSVLYCNFCNVISHPYCRSFALCSTCSFYVCTYNSSTWLATSTGLCEDVCESCQPIKTTITIIAVKYHLTATTASDL